MVSEMATGLRGALEQKLQELGEALGSLDEEKAEQRPADGEWCCKEILSHLLGDEGASYVEGLKPFLDEDTPLISVVTGLPYYTPQRQAMSLSELRAGVWKQYNDLAEFLGGLSDEQLARKVRIPLLKDSPIGEYATLAQWAGALINVHLQDHINQARSARQAISA